MNKARRIGIAVAYYLAWLCIVTGVAYLLLCLPFLVNADLRLDDDIAYLVGIPVGLIFFFPVARKLVYVRRLHWFNVVAGIVGISASIPFACHMFRQSASLTGVTGPLAGTGEAVVGYVMLLLGVFFFAVMLAGITGLKMGGPTKLSSAASKSTPSAASEAVQS